MANEIVTETHGRVRLITLNRPEARNAVNSALGLALVAAIEELDSDDGLTAGVLTGAGRGFSAGMDLTGSMKLIFSDNTQADYVAAATQTQIKLLVDDSSNNRRLEVEASSVSWEQYTPEFKDVNNYVSLALPSVQALYNSTDSGVAQVTVESGDATY